MRKALLVAIIFFSTTTAGYSTTIDTEEVKTARSPVHGVGDQAQEISSPERRGCCSWHGGVCGCEDGRALCCDGTLSPTCGCD